MMTIAGWQGIGTYIGKSVSTAQRYARKLNLPVRRSGNGPKAPVFAITSELDRWIRQFPDAGGLKRFPHGSLDTGEHPLNAVLMERVRSLTGVALYRREYRLTFSLSPTKTGVRIAVNLSFVLINSSDQPTPFVQEVTIDDVERGDVQELALFKNGAVIYMLKAPAMTTKPQGYSVYQGPKRLIEPDNGRTQYACRASWTINRPHEDYWYNHMVLPTLGVHVETKAPPQYTITPPFSESRLMLRGEHLDITWHRNL